VDSNAKALKAKEFDDFKRSETGEFITYEFLQVFHWDGALFEDGFVIAAEIEFISEPAFHFVAETLHRHPPDEIGAELAGRLFRADDLLPRFLFGLKRLVHEE